MRTSNIIKKLLGSNELVQHKFTISLYYVQIKLIIALLKWLLIFAVLAFVLFFLNNQRLIMLPQNNAELVYDPILGLQAERGVNANEPTFILYILAAIFFFIVVPILSFYYLYYLRISREYFFTNQRILVKHGWISTKSTSVHYNRITDASITQSLMERLLKIGTLSISTAGSEGYRMSLPHVKNPHDLKRQLYGLKETYRQQPFSVELPENQDY